MEVVVVGVVEVVVVEMEVHLEDTFGCKFFLWKEERVRLMVGSPGASTTPIYSPGSSSTPEASTPPRYSRELQHLKDILGNFKKCTVLKLQALA
ncbi:hypothetical protein Tco_0601514 [Tanacetum coccineum]